MSRILLVRLACLAACTASPTPKLPGQGPRTHETGRFRYKDFSQPGNFLLCYICLSKALNDSKYANMQVSQCSDFYYMNSNKSSSELLSDVENKNGWYPFCNEGLIPGCGVPPFNVANATWLDDGDLYYPGMRYNAYSISRLYCNLTGHLVAQVYCNESLVWHIDFHNTSQCHVAVTETYAADPNIAMYVGVPISAVVVLLLAVVMTIYCPIWKKRKQSPSRHTSNEERVRLPPQGAEIDSVPSPPGPNGHVVNDASIRGPGTFSSFSRLDPNDGTRDELVCEVDSSSIGEHTRDHASRDAAANSYNEVVPEFVSRGLSWSILDSDRTDVKQAAERVRLPPQGAEIDSVPSPPGPNGHVVNDASIRGPGTFSSFSRFDPNDGTRDELVCEVYSSSIGEHTRDHASRDAAANSYNEVVPEFVSRRLSWSILDSDRTDVEQDKEAY